MGKHHTHGHDLISKIHSNKTNEFTFGIETYKFDRVPDDDDTAQARIALHSSPEGEAELIAMGDALAYQMRYNDALVYYERAKRLYPDSYLAHRKCAIRYMSVLDVSRAETELEWCLARCTDKLDVKYLLALCKFYSARYADAKNIFIDCYPLAEGNDEMYIALIYWHLLCSVRLDEDVADALLRYSDTLDCGHHIGYEKTVRLFATDGAECEPVIDDELNASIFHYGAHAYYLYKDDTVRAAAELDKAYVYDKYFSSFAYLGIYLDKLAKDCTEKENALRRYFARNSKLAIAFSGGVDSVYLCHAAKSCGADVKAYFVRSEFQPEFELQDAIKLANEIGVELEVLNVGVCGDERIAANAPDRCYHCKSKLFLAIAKAADGDGYTVIADGTNASDDLSDRPGMRAVRERGVVSPLLECGLTKTEIRYLCKKVGLPVWDKPSYSCLATRIASAERITRDKLKKIESAEKILFAKGYRNFRVRCKGDCAQLEIARAQENKFQEEKQEILNELTDIFGEVKKSEVLR